MKKANIAPYYQPKKIKKTLHLIIGFIQVLAEQPPDTWDSFPLFQILNDYLRTDGISSSPPSQKYEKLISKENLAMYISKGKICRIIL